MRASRPSGSALFSRWRTATETVSGTDSFCSVGEALAHWTGWSPVGKVVRSFEMAPLSYGHTCSVTEFDRAYPSTMRAATSPDSWLYQGKATRVPASLCPSQAHSLSWGWRHSRNAEGPATAHWRVKELQIVSDRAGAEFFCPALPLKCLDCRRMYYPP